MKKSVAVAFVKVNLTGIVKIAADIMCNPCNEKHQAANIFNNHVIVAGDRNTGETTECKTHP